VRDNFCLNESFVIDEASRQRLLEGKDVIDLILNHESDIAAYERRVPTL
jgi:3-isopropylmalate dehydratase small subunit